MLANEVGGPSGLTHRIAYIRPTQSARLVTLSTQRFARLPSLGARHPNYKRETIAFLRVGLVTPVVI